MSSLRPMSHTLRRHRSRALSASSAATTQLPLAANTTSRSTATELTTPRGPPYVSSEFAPRCAFQRTAPEPLSSATTSPFHVPAYTYAPLMTGVDVMTLSARYVQAARKCTARFDRRFVTNPELL